MEAMDEEGLFDPKNKEDYFIVGIQTSAYDQNGNNLSVIASSSSCFSCSFSDPSQYLRGSLTQKSTETTDAVRKGKLKILHSRRDLTSN